MQNQQTQNALEWSCVRPCIGSHVADANLALVEFSQMRKHSNADSGSRNNKPEEVAPIARVIGSTDDTCENCAVRAVATFEDMSTEKELRGIGGQTS